MHRSHVETKYRQHVATTHQLKDSQTMNEKLSFSLPDEINLLQRAEAIRPAPINPTFILDFTWYSSKLWKNTVL